MTEVEDTIRELKTIHGFNAYCILNNDGIVIKYDNMTYQTAIHHAHQILSLVSKAGKYIQDLFEAPDNVVESLRLKTNDYEMVVAQQLNFTMIVTQSPVVEEEVKKGEEGKEGEKKADEV
jgi:hypothetical protein